MTASPYTTSVTQLLARINEGEAAASEQLIEVVYDELRRIAEARIRKEPAELTLQATALVHEAWMRLERGPLSGWSSRAHFFGAVANAMRNILIDQARRRGRAKHGGDRDHEALTTRIEMDSGLLDADILELNDAIERLQTMHDRPGRIVTLRFFAGVTIPEIAKMFGVSERTIDREWQFARAWLRRALS